MSILVKYTVLLVIYSVALIRIIITVKRANLGKFNLSMVVVHFIILALFFLSSVMSLVAFIIFLEKK